MPALNRLFATAKAAARTIAPARTNSRMCSLLSIGVPDMLNAGGRWRIQMMHGLARRPRCPPANSLRRDQPRLALRRARASLLGPRKSVLAAVARGRARARGADVGRGPATGGVRSRSDEPLRAPDAVGGGASPRRVRRREAAARAQDSQAAPAAGRVRRRDALRALLRKGAPRQTGSGPETRPD